ncbi:MAG: CRISPR-associated endonuclease Cas1 [Gammaproteobacteria bacterium]|nr:MAG: CRISPR-associated endonuclease Cas1 [Gammaproteobacteria bacterium]
MTTLYLDRRALSLEVQGGAVVLRHNGKLVQTIPLTMLERIVAHGKVYTDTGALARLAEAGVGFFALTGRRIRFGAALVGRPHGDVCLRLEQYQGYLDPLSRRRWARRVVRAKVAGEMRFLRRLLVNRPGQRHALEEALARLEAEARRLEDEDLSISALLGIEGAAAAAYFSGFSAVFPPSLGFSGRNRRPPRDPVNACLSLGYTLLHAEAIHAAHGAGLDAMVGFLHEPAFGRESGALDLAEPFRVYVDRLVFELFALRILRKEHFKAQGEGVLLGKAGRSRFYAHYEALAASLRRLLRRTAQAVARELAP